MAKMGRPFAGETEKNVPVSFRLTREYADKLSALQERIGCTKVELLERMIDTFYSLQFGPQNQ